MHRATPSRLILTAVGAAALAAGAAGQTYRTERLEALGIASVVFAPAGNRTPPGDYLAVQRANADRLEAALAD